MPSFDPAQYGPACARLLEHVPVCPLDAGEPNESLRAELAALTAQQLFPDARIVDRQMAECCLAGLWLVHGFLDESHRISQSINNTSGSFWHGIMHRREGDYGNSKYWMRQVGNHPVISDLKARFPAYQDPFHFIDLCEAAVRRGDAGNQQLCSVQQAEWQLLLDHCYRNM